MAARFLKQSITLVGLGASSFDQIVASMDDVGEFMGRQILNGELTTKLPLKVNGHQGIGITNRYFTWRHTNHTGEAVDFPRMVDPKKALTNMVDNNYVHTIDNEVDYSDCNVIDGGRNE